MKLETCSIWGLKIEILGTTRFLGVPGLGKPVMSLTTCDTSVCVVSDFSFKANNFSL